MKPSQRATRFLPAPPGSIFNIAKIQTVLGFNLLDAGLQNVLNPRLKRR